MAPDGAINGRGRHVGHVLTGDAWAGAETQAWQLVRHLPDYGFLPHVAVLNPGQTLDRFAALDLPTTLLDERQLGRRMLVTHLHAWLAESNLALVHVHKAKEEILIGLGGRPDRRLPLIRTLHGAPELPRGRNRWKGIVAYALDSYALRYRTAGVIAVSADLAASYRRFLGRTPLHVIHNGVPLSPPSVAQSDEHPPRLVYCGRLARVKAIDRLIAAMPLVRRAIPTAELWIAGSGPEEQALRELAARLELRDAIRFLGFCPDLQPVFREVDVVVLSSKHEGLPMIVLEAGAAGKPVVAPHVGGIPEVVRNGETGVLLTETAPDTIASACVALLGDRAHARTLGAAARQRIAAEFSADATARATAALYSDALARQPQGQER